jgi:hypothetical protein
LERRTCRGRWRFQNPLEGRPPFGVEGGIAVIQTTSMRLDSEIRSTVAGHRLQAEQFVYDIPSAGDLVERLWRECLEAT